MRRIRLDIDEKKLTEEQKKQLKELKEVRA